MADVRVVLTVRAAGSGLAQFDGAELYSEAIPSELVGAAEALIPSAVSISALGRIAVSGDDLVGSVTLSGDGIPAAVSSILDLGKEFVLFSKPIGAIGAFLARSVFGAGGVSETVLAELAVLS